MEIKIFMWDFGYPRIFLDIGEWDMQLKVTSELSVGVLRTMTCVKQWTIWVKENLAYIHYTNKQYDDNKYRFFPPFHIVYRKYSTFEV